MAVDGQRVFSDVAPVTAGGVAYLPIRAIGDAAGAGVSYDAASGGLIVRRGATTLRMAVGTRRAVLDGHVIELSHAPFTVHGRAMVRGVDVAFALGSVVRYDARHGSIEVRTPGAVVAGVPDDAP
jgi:N-acetylmuramoyl-L-alanine amidase